MSDEAAAAIVSILHRHEVRFVVIGGFAIQLHGVDGLARTSDIDVTPERSRVNLERLAAALSDLDARLRGLRLPDEGLAVSWHVDLLDRVDTALNLITKFGPLDISLKPSGTDGTTTSRLDLSSSPSPTPLFPPPRSTTSSARRRPPGGPRTISPCPCSSGSCAADPSHDPPGRR